MRFVVRPARLAAGPGRPARSGRGGGERRRRPWRHAPAAARRCCRWQPQAGGSGHRRRCGCRPPSPPPGRPPGRSPHRPPGPSRRRSAHPLTSQPARQPTRPARPPARPAAPTVRRAGGSAAGPPAGGPAAGGRESGGAWGGRGDDPWHEGGTAGASEAQPARYGSFLSQLVCLQVVLGSAHRERQKQPRRPRRRGRGEVDERPPPAAPPNPPPKSPPGHPPLPRSQHTSDPCNSHPAGGLPHRCGPPVQSRLLKGRATPCRVHGSALCEGASRRGHVWFPSWGVAVMSPWARALDRVRGSPWRTRASLEG